RAQPAALRLPAFERRRKDPVMRYRFSIIAYRYDNGTVFDFPKLHRRKRNSHLHVHIIYDVHTVG
ncbi:MAG: hypothetical protein WCF50_21830, partial [Pseudolabrys sp.]